MRCRIISGDNPVTVGAIARKVRLTGDAEPRFMDARELPTDITELAKVLENVDVLGRVLPDQKKAIVQALHLGDHVVAMTGDGVNDALAIKEPTWASRWATRHPPPRPWRRWCSSIRNSRICDVVARGRPGHGQHGTRGQPVPRQNRIFRADLVRVVLTQIPFPYLPRHITYIAHSPSACGVHPRACAEHAPLHSGLPQARGALRVAGGIATALSILADSWLLPKFMGWDAQHSAAQLGMLRGVNAIILLMMGIFVLARVARPLNSWRGGLVLAFAVAGVAGMFIPPVARFFALVIPSGEMLAATGVALVVSAIVFVLCLWCVPKMVAIFSRFKKTRQC